MEYYDFLFIEIMLFKFGYKIKGMNTCRSYKYSILVYLLYFIIRCISEKIISGGKIMIYENIMQTIGKTPIVKLKNLTDEIKAIYKEALSKAGIENEQIEVSETELKRKFEIQKIITESGIEVKIPVNYYGDPSKLEFVANGDGTVSLVIKNIGNIQS